MSLAFLAAGSWTSVYSIPVFGDPGGTAYTDGNVIQVRCAKVLNWYHIYCKGYNTIGYLWGYLFLLLLNSFDALSEWVDNVSLPS